MGRFKAVFCFLASYLYGLANMNGPTLPRPGADISSGRRTPSPQPMRRTASGPERVSPEYLHKTACGWPPVPPISPLVHKPRRRAYFSCQATNQSLPAAARPHHLPGNQSRVLMRPAL